MNRFAGTIIVLLFPCAIGFAANWEKSSEPFSFPGATATSAIHSPSNEMVLSGTVSAGKIVFSFRLPKATDNATIRIYASDGSLMSVIPVLKSSKQASFPVSSTPIAAGIYLATLSSENAKKILTVTVVE
jgi:hypothetical protein